MDEVGNEYTLEALRGLQLPKVVCLQREDYPSFWITLWLVVVEKSALLLKSENFLLLLFIKDGRITDDSGKTLRLAEYLGEI